MSTVFCNYIRRVNNEHISLSSNGKEMCDVSVVARGARYRDAGLPAVLREGRVWTCTVYGTERPYAHTRDGLSALGEVGEAVNGHVG